MKKIIVVAIMLLSASDLVQAESVQHEYSASVSGSPHCKMPADTEKPARGECVVKKNFIETGTKIEKNGDVCIEKTSTLVTMRKIRNGNMEIESPVIDTTMKVVKCKDVGL